MYRETHSIQTVKTVVKMINNIFSHEDDSLLFGGDSKRRLVFVDSEVFIHFIHDIDSYFNNKNIEAKIIPVECSEAGKDLETLMFVLQNTERFNLLRRNEPIIAIGGGVLLDIIGFAASIFRRGVPYIKVPTTLLGMIDASVGAKTSINHFGRRNRLGSYYPAIQTVIDKRFLQTLKINEIYFSLGEIIKMAVIKDAGLFSVLEDNIDACIRDKFLNDKSDIIIETSIHDMLDELEPNLWEKDLKRCVDFGHSFSPLLEMNSLEDNSVYSLSHGEAVALDVLFSCAIAKHRNLMSEEDLGRVVAMCDKCHLKTHHPYFDDSLILWDSLLDTVRHRDGHQNLPIPVGIGKHTFINDLTLGEIKSVIEGIKA